jgi:hypothetical protein
MVSHSIKKFSALYGAPRFIAVSTSPRFLYLIEPDESSPRPSITFLLRLILKLSFHLRLGLKSRLFDRIKMSAAFLK